MEAGTFSSGWPVYQSTFDLGWFSNYSAIEVQAQVARALKAHPWLVFRTVGGDPGGIFSAGTLVVSVKADRSWSGDAVRDELDTVIPELIPGLFSRAVDFSTTFSGEVVAPTAVEVGETVKETARGVKESIPALGNAGFGIAAAIGAYLLWKVL